MNHETSLAIPARNVELGDRPRETEIRRSEQRGRTCHRTDKALEGGQVSAASHQMVAMLGAEYRVVRNCLAIRTLYLPQCSPSSSVSAERLCRRQVAVAVVLKHRTTALPNGSLRSACTYPMELVALDETAVNGGGHDLDGLARRVLELFHQLSF